MLIISYPEKIHEFLPLIHFVESLLTTCRSRKIPKSCFGGEIDPSVDSPLYEEREGGEKIFYLT